MKNVREVHGWGDNTTDCKPITKGFTISDSPGMTLNFTAGRSLQLASITEILGKRRLSSDGFERGDELCGEPHVLRSFAERGETGELNHLLAYSFLLPLSFRSTHIQVVGFDNRPFARTSCGTEGFQNAKKGTAIAAQTAGIAAATRGSLTASCCYLGTGEWRTSTGLTMGGLEIISITDNTPVPHNGCRPRKARRM
uniref:Ribosomal protein S11 n=1 Tax=Anas zonorhyncha TaxID=75864 RepID=A0A8B9V927_9AVES